MEKLDWYGRPVTPYDDIIDTRKIIERIEEIESEYDDGEGETHGIGIWAPLDREEWVTLTDLLSEIGEDACRDGVTLIRESYFKDYVREGYGEIGPELHEYRSKSGRATWDMEYVRVEWDELMSRPPFNCIDWEAVAEDERSDYSIVEFLGTTYYYQGA